MSEKLYTMVAGGALEANSTFNVRCNCGGNAPITPESVAGYGYSKKGGPTKIVDRLETKCLNCNTGIVVSVLEGDPGYVLTKHGNKEMLFLPQGSTSKPVAELTVGEHEAIIQEMKKNMPDE
ncbi:MAG: hypothetical protein KDA88_09655 [Planctomycetaceae bacterium]|nr:hypothetical protein [Planctomycetaceae bacterium]MCB9952410.1 hypothetical protein [Planctomycetaceae bacterium]